METTVKIGNKGEEYSKDYFKNQGFTILEQNWKHLNSEIDLIVKKKNMICFVEVKTRNSNFFIDPVLSVSTSQQKRILKAAHHYIELNSLDQDIRFDVVGIVINGNKIKLEHIKEAFYPSIDQT